MLVGKEETHTQNVRVNPTPDHPVHKLWADRMEGGLEGSFNLILSHTLTQTLKPNSDPDFDHQLWRDPNSDPDSRLWPQTLTQTLTLQTLALNSDPNCKLWPQTLTQTLTQTPDFGPKPWPRPQTLAQNSHPDARLWPQTLTQTPDVGLKL